MPDTKFLETMNRREKRFAAKSLRGVQKCLECNLFGACYKETQRILEIRKNHKGNGLLPKDARELPRTICEYHENRIEKGRFYPAYDYIKVTE